MVEYSAGRVQGPLAPFAAGFVVELVARGYQPRSVRGQLELMAHLSGWLAEQGLEPAGLTENIAERFLAVRRERDVNLEKPACVWSVGRLFARARGRPGARGLDRHAGCATAG